MERGGEEGRVKLTLIKVEKKKGIPETFSAISQSGS
jgi:hypothetical protein